MLRYFKPRILCVDDEPSIAELLQAVFQQHGDYLVEAETDPLNALARARRFKPDLIILDINMPKLSGIELARQIRQEPWLCHRPIVFYSGVSDSKEAALKANGDGLAAFLTKGVPLALIEKTVEELLSERLQLYKAYVAA